MEREGPLLEGLTRRLGECPIEFLGDPSAEARVPGSIDVAAIVCDHFRAMGTTFPASDVVAKFLPWSTPESLNRLRVIAIATWLLHDDWFLSRKDLGLPMQSLLGEKLDSLATVVRAETFVTDPDRREELVRTCLKHLGLRLQGETEVEAADRLASLDSLERERILRDTAQAEKRARAVREMMARRAAAEAAAKTSRE
jgi:hypothetical protein